MLIIMKKKPGTHVSFESKSFNFSKLATFFSSAPRRGAQLVKTAGVFMILLWGSLISFTTTAQVTVTNPGNTTPALAATYPSLANAITALNATTAISGQVIITVTANQTAPSGGYSITAIPAGASDLNNIIIDGNAKTITAFSPQPTGQFNNAIFKLIGADYITIRNFTMQENAGNTTAAAATNNMTEIGVALFYASVTNGAQHNTIQNNTISLNRIYLNTFGIYSNTRHSSTSMAGAAEVTAASGSNSWNKVYGNTISNVNSGIVFIGAGTTLAAIDDGNDIGGSSAVTGNIITDWGGGRTVSGYLSYNYNSGIFSNQQINDNISFNTVTSAAMTSTTGCEGIHKDYTIASPTSGVVSATINNNSIQVNTTVESAGSNFVYGIFNGGLNAPGAITDITNNTIHNSTFAGNTLLSILIGIYNSSGVETLNITGNVITSSSATHVDPAASANIYGVFNTGDAGTANINNNSFTENYAQSSFSGIINSQGTVGTLNVNNNVFSNISAAGGNLICMNIESVGGVTNELNINNNQIGTAAGGLVVGNGFFGISFSGGASTCRTSIKSNDFRAITIPSPFTGSATFISSRSGQPIALDISSNTFTSLNLTTNNNVVFITVDQNMPAGGSRTIANNAIVNGLTGPVKPGTPNFFNVVACIRDFGLSPNGSTTTIEGNNFSNISTTGAVTINGIENNGGTGARICTGNIFNSWTGGALTGVNLVAVGGAGSSISNNSFTNMSGTGNIRGITVGNVASNATSLTIDGNLITGLTSFASVFGANITGISSSNASPAINISNNRVSALSATPGANGVTGISVSGSTTNNIFRNNICDLSGGSATSTVNGILASGGTTNTIYNNIIGDLRTPAANASNPLIGISLTGGATANVFYNTVYLNASSTGALFGSSALSASTTPALTLRNNIFYNASGVTGAGLAAAYRRANTVLTSFNAASNNNLFYGSTIFTNGTNTDATLIAYKTRVAPRDGASVTENLTSSPAFLSTTCGAGNFLHMSTTVATETEGGGTAIAGITDDYDGNPRNGSTPDIGADEFSGLIADNTPPFIYYTPLFNSACNGNNQNLSAIIVDARGINSNPGMKPRLYFRKSTDINTYTGNSATDNGWKYVEASNASSPFQFTTDFSLLQSPVIPGDTIKYFVVAQDLSTPVHVGLNSGTFAAPPGGVALTAAAFPVTGLVNSTIITGLVTYYIDIDGDGYGSNEDYFTACPEADGYPGYVLNNTDCEDYDETVWQSALLYRDADRDGYDNGSAQFCYGATLPNGYSKTTLGQDCNDSRAAVNPGATEICDGIDNNCNDQIDEGVKTTFYRDEDGDGYGHVSQVLQTCAKPIGYVSDSTDCDDADNTKWQSAMLYVDVDQDGYDNGQATVCYGATIPVGYAATTSGADCDDNNIAIHASETWYLDADSDGHYVSSQLSCGSPGAGYNTTGGQQGDCDDDNDTTWQSASLYIDVDKDGYDNGQATVCYGATIPVGYAATTSGTDCDDNNGAIHAPVQYYIDADRDGFGSTATAMLCSLTATPGYSTNNTDCNDNDAAIHAPVQYYVDADRDGFGSTTTAMVCSLTATTGYSTNNTDCDDNDAAIHAPVQYYVDADRDGFGSTTTAMLCSLTATAGYSTNNTDCNDYDAAIHAPVQYFVDADRDGFGSTATAMLCSLTATTGYSTNNTDCNDSDTAIHAPVQYYVDADRDGFGSTATAMVCSLTATTGYSTNNTDCNDNDAAIHAPVQYYVDADRDGFGSTATAMVCSSTATVGYSTNNTDCNDNDAAIHAPVQYYVDADRDGFGSTATAMLCSLTAPIGYSMNNTDCNDTMASVNPNAPEICDGLDNNCNGQTDETGCSTICANGINQSTSNITATSAKLNWNASVDPTAWAIQYKTRHPNSKWTDVIPEPTPSSRSVILTGLISDQLYLWRMRAKCGKSQTPYSATIEFTTGTVSTISRIGEVTEMMPTENKTPALVIYPNPSPGQFIVSLRLTEKINATAKLEVMDRTGRLVHTGTAVVNNGLLQKNVTLSSVFAAGIYTVRVIANGKIYISKLMYQR